MRSSWRGLAVLFLGVVLSCTDSPSAPETLTEDLEEFVPTLGMVSSVPAVCGTATTTPLVAFGTAVGTVSVVNDESNLYVTYTTSSAWPLKQTALFVGDSPQQIPLTRFKTPKTWRFPYRQWHAWGTTEVIWEVPLGEVSGSEATIAAFALARFRPAWGDGERIHPRWRAPTYFTHVIQSCEPGTVGPAGGELTSEDGGLSISIPAGALDQDVQITVDPVTVEALLAHAAGTAPAAAPGVPGSESAAAMVADGTINGVTPIPGAIYDLGPDGLQFAEPFTVTIAYDEANLPAGVSEESLKLFLINGVFPAPPEPQVDVVANTVTAQFDHFSFFFVGAELAAFTDLAVSGLFLSAADTPAKVGASLDFSATVDNLGPDPSNGGTVTYTAFGDVVLGSVFAGCSEVVTPVIGDVAITCDVAALAPTASDGIPAFQIVVQSVGNVEVWASVSTAGTDVDTNADNDLVKLITAVEPAVVADLTVSRFDELKDPVKVGERAEYSTDVTNLGPDDVAGATVTYTVFGDVALGTIVPTCTEIVGPAVGDVAVSCPVAFAIPAGETRGAPSFLVDPQSAGQITVWASVSALPGDTDPDLTNNRMENVTTVDPAVVADLGLTSLLESADPIEIGQSVEYTATLGNWGPDDVSAATVYYIGFGDVTVGALSAGCTEITPPLVGQAEVQCAVGSIPFNTSAGAPPATFVPGSTGTFTVWADADSEGTDPVADNDRAEETFTVTGRVADLRIDRTQDLPDPVQLGQDVTYQADVLAAPGTAQAVDGALLTLTLTAGATLQSSNSACFETVIGITCPLGSLPPGLVNTVEVTLRPAAAGPLQVTFRALVPAGTTDPDALNHIAIETTTVEAAGAPGITVGEILAGSIDVAGEVDEYVFDGTAGQLVRLHGSRSPGSTLNAQLELRNPSGIEIFPLSGFGGDFDDRGSANDMVTLPTTGEYMLRVVSENGTTGTYRVGVGRGAGRLDTSFGTGGIVKGPLSGSVPQPFLQMDLTGDAVVTVGQLTLSRFTAGGQPDAGFGLGGVVDLNTALGTSVMGTSVSVQPDGKIVVGAIQDLNPWDWIVARFNADGTLDTTFDTDGWQLIDVAGVGTDNEIQSIRFAPDGAGYDVVLAGNVDTQPNQVGIARLNADGSLDTGFGGTGLIQEAQGMLPREMDLQSDGKVVVFGTSTSGGVVLRYTTAGVLDTSFGSAGRATVAASGDAYWGGAVLSNDDVVLLGQAGVDGLVARLTANGSPATGFGSGGVRLYDFGLSDRLVAAAEDASGNLVVAGWQRTTGGESEFLVARMAADGTLDTTFGAGGYVLEERVEEGRDVAVDSQGRIVVGGQKTGSQRGVQLTRHIP